MSIYHFLLTAKLFCDKIYTTEIGGLMMGVNDLLEQAKNEISGLHTNEKFALKDLFKGYEWKRIKQGEKSTLGTLFLNFAQSSDNIEIVQKTNGIIYKKLG